MTPYTDYPAVQGIIYQDELNRNRLMRTDKLHKFSDATFNHVRITLNDIATGIQMNYFPKRRWSPQDKESSGDDKFDTSAGNPVKEILLKLNLPDHRSILTDSKVTPTNHGRMTKPYSSPRFIANCFNAGYLKMEVKRQSVKVKEIQERCIIKAFQDYQIKKGMSMSVQKSQVHEMAKSTRWRNEIMLG
ncbi:hypothetical protein Tco_0105545 [Tanacetum coccineum]